MAQVQELVSRWLEDLEGLSERSGIAGQDYAL